MSAKLPPDEKLANKRARDKAYYMAHRKQRIAYAAAYGKLWRAANPGANNAINRRHRRKVREDCLLAYGGVCVCCGLNQLEFLSIDHVNGGGSQHRRDNKLSTAGFHTYRWLKAQGYPQDGFRCLCYKLQPCAPISRRHMSASKQPFLA